MTPQDKSFGVDLKDEVVRGSIVTLNGEILPPAPRPAPPPAPAPKAAVKKEEEAVALTPFQKTSREVATVTAGMGTALALGKLTGPLFMGNAFTFGLASLIGYRVVWGVSPALHSPLMSVTNAISGKLPCPLGKSLSTDRIIRNGRGWRLLCHGRRLSARDHSTGSRCCIRASGFRQHLRRICDHEEDAGHVQT